MILEALEVAVAVAVALDVMDKLGEIAWRAGEVGDGRVGGMSCRIVLAARRREPSPPPGTTPVPTSSTPPPAIPNFAFSASARPWSWLLLVVMLLVMVVAVLADCRSTVIMDDDGGKGARAGCTTTHRSKSLVGDPTNMHIMKRHDVRGCNMRRCDVRGYVVRS